MKAKQILTKLGACSESIEWVGDRTMQEAWDKCERADWMLWIMARGITQGDAQHRMLIGLACDCAATVLQYVPAGEDRPRLAIEAARRYADNPTEEHRADAGDAAWAAWSAWAAGDAAGVAARAAGYAAGVAWAAGDALAAARAAAHKSMCAHIREVCPKVPTTRRARQGKG
jgi:hypothetical protein